MFGCMDLSVMSVVLFIGPELALLCQQRWDCDVCLKCTRAGEIGGLSHQEEHRFNPY